MAAAVRRLGRGGVGLPGAPASVDDLGRRREQDAPAPRAERGAEVDVLGVEEEPLVQEAHRLGVPPPCQQAGAADPVDVARLRGAPRRPARGQRQAGRSRPCDHLLPQLVPRRDHPAERQLERAVRGHDARPGDGRGLVGVEGGDQPVDAPRRGDGVAVQQEDQLAPAPAHAEVGGVREAGVGAEPDEVRLRPSGRHCVRAAVRGSVVDHDDLVGDDGCRVAERPEARLEAPAGVEADDDDGQARRRGAVPGLDAAHGPPVAACSSTSSISAAARRHVKRSRRAAPRARSRARSVRSSSSRSISRATSAASSTGT